MWRLSRDTEVDIGPGAAVRRVRPDQGRLPLDERPREGHARHAATSAIIWPPIPTAKIVVVTNGSGIEFLLDGAKDKNGNPYERRSRT